MMIGTMEKKKKKKENEGTQLETTTRKKEKKKTDKKNLMFIFGLIATTFKQATKCITISTDISLLSYQFDGGGGGMGGVKKPFIDKMLWLLAPLLQMALKIKKYIFDKL